MALAVSLAAHDAPTTLFFKHVADQRLRIAEYGRDNLAATIARAGAVVIVRALFEMPAVVRTARWLNVPLYYFADDNFVVVREQGGAAALFAARYSEANVRRALQPFAGVWLATAALLEDFSERRLHDELRPYPPAAGGCSDSPFVTSRECPFTVAFFGGEHLRSQFLDVIVPAVRRLALMRPVRLVAIGIPASIAPSPGLEVTQRPYVPSYDDGVAQLREQHVDALVHPVARGLASNRFKNPHAVITAAALGAVAIVSAEPPYTALRDDGVVLFSDGSEDSWFNALVEATSDERRIAMALCAQQYCRAAFNGSINRVAIDQALSAPATASHPVWRTTVSSAVFGATRVAAAGMSRLRRRPHRS